MICSTHHPKASEYRCLHTELRAKPACAGESSILITSPAAVAVRRAAPLIDDARVPVQTKSIEERRRTAAKRAREGGVEADSSESGGASAGSGAAFEGGGKAAGFGGHPDSALEAVRLPRARLEMWQVEPVFETKRRRLRTE